MKIVLSDNYARPWFEDVLVAEKVEKKIGERIVKLLNENEDKNSSNYYELVEDDYKLYTVD